MPPPLADPPSHEQQLRLRETMRAAESYIAKGLQHFEKLTGISVRSIELVRWDSGSYGPTIQLGARVAPPADPRQQQG